MVSDPLEVLRDRGVLVWEPLTPADYTEVATLAAAIEHLDDALERHSIEDILDTLEKSGEDVSQLGVVGRDRQGSIVAYGIDLVHPKDTSPRRVRLVGGIHPAWRDKGIGHGLLDWHLAAAKRWDFATRRAHHGPLKVYAVADSKLTAMRELYESYGLLPETWYLDAHRTFNPAHPPKRPQVPDAVALRPYNAMPAAAVLAAHNEAFLGRLGAAQLGPAEWHESMTRPGSRPDLSWVLTVGDRVVGYALNCVEETGDDGFQEGWTDRLGVIPAWRGRGLSGVLLQASAASFFDAGLPGAGIGVDTEDPIREMARYRGLGYDAVDALVGYARVLN
ncbi:MAG TPA: GNAT family N-acetyltransferase [Propionibacteriaceae bacterium]|nr:GNAT family N-acetyltransferase [Propionibacteriaceae bacterium]